MTQKFARLAALFLLLVGGACRTADAPAPTVSTPATSLATAIPTTQVTPAFSATEAVELTNTATASSIIVAAKPGFGVLGDSSADEYQADDDRGGIYEGFTLNWVELLSRQGLYFGSWDVHEEPRRIGYSFNWARSGATAAEMRAEQAAGLVAQVQAGEVNTVVLRIGANDFNTSHGGYQKIYEGMPQEELDAKLNEIVEAIELTLADLRVAGVEKLLLVSIFDPNLVPARETQFPNAAGRQAVSEAVERVNRRLQAVAKVYNLPFADLNVYVSQLISESEDGLLDVGGELIDIWAFGDEPHNGMLVDEHAGTVLNGLMARYLMMQLNDFYGTDYPLLSDEQILIHAGLKQ